MTTRTQLASSANYHPALGLDENDGYDQFFKEMLEHYNQDMLSRYQQEASILALDLNRPRLVAIIEIKDFALLCLGGENLASFEKNEVIRNWKRKIEEAVNNFFTRNSDVFTAYLGDDRFALAMVAESDREEIVKLRLKKSFHSIFGQLLYRPIESLTVGFGAAHLGVAGLAEAIYEANIALRMGLKLEGQNRSYDFEDFGILYTFAEGDLQKKAKIAAKVLSAVDHSKSLSPTLKKFFENNLSVAETANKLGVHRNTVIYRLGRIADEIGLDPRIFQEAVVIKTAMLIQKLA